MAPTVILHTVRAQAGFRLFAKMTVLRDFFRIVTKMGGCAINTLDAIRNINTVCLIATKSGVTRREDLCIEPVSGSIGEIFYG
ncbi:hypothetical protein [Novosphingobium mangrovi (ex Huang et al. 2023)]|uniref:Uncharacterized protein n=1 Tax=Novosphingobium mangrovi (ex Huang et al. 2023) TaxID=2976432 RepID=A0ABT2I417_9SPHN|nr:hypothetical protein [Novosphingobium mangrovi (ex Huang et al. 2023)]MCT2399548.1 hypothetical protein [Novosphingobium mangrovi (ex Huang et al. 2023)]